MEQFGAIVELSQNSLQILGSRNFGRNRPEPVVVNNLFRLAGGYKTERLFGDVQDCNGIQFATVSRMPRKARISAS